ncbi:MAG: hypothetical protein ACOCRX_04915 [Candidatus Woesearchaeota archaeon]
MSERKRKYYILNTCDAWKSYDSFGLVGIFTWSELIKIIKRKIKSKVFEFNGEIRNMINKSPRELNTNLEYGFVQEIKINEEQ